MSENAAIEATLSNIEVQIGEWWSYGLHDHLTLSPSENASFLENAGYGYRARLKDQPYGKDGGWGPIATSSSEAKFNLLAEIVGITAKAESQDDFFPQECILRIRQVREDLARNDRDYAIPLLDAIVSKARVDMDPSYKDTLVEWLEGGVSTIALRDVLCDPFRHSNIMIHASKKSKYPFDDLFMALDSAAYHVRRFMEAPADPAPGRTFG